MTKIIFITHFEPNSVGHGGNHRSYQILEDLKSAFGADDVLSFSLPEWYKTHKPQTHTNKQNLSLFVKLYSNFMNTITRVIRVIGFCHQCITRRNDPLFFLERLPVFAKITAKFSKTEYINEYKTLISHHQNILCVVEHVGFSSIIDINLQHNIPTIICIQNIESWDENIPFDGKSQNTLPLSMLDFSNEYDVIRRCTQRLFISKLERDIFQGLGLNGFHYPYIPVNEIRNSSLSIRTRRENTRVDRTLFLLIGTFNHLTTAQSIKWFLKNCQTKGFPADCKLLVIGNGTEKLTEEGFSHENISILGWVNQNQLEDYLVAACAVIVPQQLGFGSLTRLPELSCAGVPVIASHHAVTTMECPPGVEIVVDYHWDNWFCAITNAMRDNTVITLDSYILWEDSQQVNFANLLS